MPFNMGVILKGLKIRTQIIDYDVVALVRWLVGEVHTLITPHID